MDSNKIMELKEKLKKIAERNCWIDQVDDYADFNPDDYAGGNMDDAYDGGSEDGAALLARELIAEFFEAGDKDE